ncbi:MAG: response regulator [Candidatus Rokubacteria bacterium]|nr:response regulator [Candidatus Rokubacteria bacterium]
MTAPFGRLLIVDDEKPVLEVLCEYFECQGHEVESAANGPDAIEAFARTRPDLVLLDVRMPGMDGVAVLERLRGLDTTPVIMVTANEDIALARRTLQLGAFDYVSKPFDFVHLDRTVTAALLHGGSLTLSMPEAPADPRRALARAIFLATRAMPAVARPSIGPRLEDVALGLALDATAAARRLDEVDLLLDLAVDLGDLGADERRRLATAVDAVRTALAAGG